MKNIESKSMNCLFLFRLCLLAVTLSLLPACAANQSKKQGWQGYSPEQAVQRRIALDSRLEDLKILVDFRDGTATLTGEVQSLSQRTIAEEDLYQVKGVRGVVNNVTVKASDISDSELSRRIFAAIPTHCLARTREMSVDVQDGRVRLTGTSYSLHHKDVIMNVARSTPGVQHVDNQIRVEPSPPEEKFTDVQMKKNIEGVIWSLSIDTSDIGVEAKDGEVTLSGSVLRYDHIDIVKTVVRNVPGVVDVKNSIEMPPDFYWEGIIY